METNTGQASFGLSSLTAKENLAISLTMGVADPEGVVTGSYRFQWQRSFDAENWFDIAAATALSFMPGDAEVNALLRVRVQYTDGQQNAETVYSPETSAVVNVNDQPVSTLAFKGTVQQGSALQLTGGVTDGDIPGGQVLAERLSWQWFAGSLPIEGANASSLVLSQSEVGKLISLEATYVDDFGTAETVRLSSSTAVVNVNDAVSGGISVEYDWQQGFVEHTTLYASASLFDLDGPGDIPSDRLTWQWFTGGVAVPGASNASLVLTQAMVGKSVSVEARYTDDLKSSEVVRCSLTDDASGKALIVANFNDQPVGALVLSGVMEQGQQITVSGTVTDADGIPTSGTGAPSWSWWIPNWWGGYDPIDGATGTRLTLTQAMVGASVVARFRYVDLFDNETEVFSAPSAPIRDRQDPPTGGVAVSGSMIEDQVLSAAGNFDDPDGIATDISWQWLADGLPIPDAVSSELSLTQAQVGKTITARAEYVDGLGKLERVTSVAGTVKVANVDDPPEGEVWIEGTPVRQGERLSARNNLVDEDGIPALGSGALAYQWFQDGQSIPGASASSLLLDQTHVGHQIQVRASYTDNFGKLERLFSAPTGLVENINDPPVYTLRIQGTLRQGERLSVTGSLSDADLFGAVPLSALQWQWFVGDQVAGKWDPFAQAIDGANASSLLLSQSEVGRTVSLRVRYTDRFDWEESIDLVGSAPVQNVNDSPSGTVSILGFEGEPVQGQILQASSSLVDADLGGALDEQELRWQWWADGVALAGANEASLELSQALVGKGLRVVASYGDAFGYTESVSSAVSPAVVNVNDPPTGALVITGTARQGRVLSVIASVLDPDGIPVTGAGAPSLQWFSDDQPIAGAVGSALTIGQSEVGHAISVRYAYTDAYGQAEEVWSDTLGPVLDAEDPVQGSIRIEGRLEEDQTLTALVEFTDPDGIGTISWLWMADGEVIAGSDSDSLTLGPLQLGKHISVEASYVDGLGVRESVLASAGAITVRNINDAPMSSEGGGPATVTILDPEWDGAVQGQMLEAVADIFDEDGIPAPGSPGVIVYQWLVDGQALAGATGRMFTPGQAQVGHEISVQASYVDLGGSVERVVSDAWRVANINDPWQGTLSIQGKPAVGAMLSVQSSLADPDGFGHGIDYQWTSNGEPIEGASGSWWRVTREQVGATIGVTANWVDGGDTPESAGASLPGVVELSSVSGRIYHWRSQAVLDHLTVAIQGQGLSASELSGAIGSGTEPVSASPRIVSVRGVAIDEQGRLGAEVWLDATESFISEFSFTLGQSGGRNFSFEPEANFLMARWRVPSATTAADGQGLSLEYSSLSGVPVPGLMRLGRVQLEPDGTGAGLRIALEAGTAGQITRTPLEPYGFTLAQAISGSDGAFAFPELDFDRYAVAVSGLLPDTGNPITSADALAALKIAVGRNPNPDPDGPGPMQAPVVSPYQVLAADADGNGTVDRTDVELILQMAAGHHLPHWMFASESLNPSSNLGVEVSGARDMNLVAVLRGDVDGSWAPPDETGMPRTDYSRIELEHFQSLYRDLGIPYAYFGLTEQTP